MIAIYIDERETHALKLNADPIINPGTYIVAPIGLKDSYKFDEALKIEVK